MLTSAYIMSCEIGFVIEATALIVIRRLSATFNEAEVSICKIKFYLSLDKFDIYSVCSSGAGDSMTTKT